ncbi:RNA-dependent RNA polymerase [Turtle grass virus X]|uniref:RNA replication protein n=1 Tax=Turtle grass virus X TaxID=2292642 RepID=A0A345X1J4_9VIRU|nr:RNA-dependent RNA polymerase [Turtle grass virus X]AXK15640.1 RNA-dependent RNA polymerase [Turtle grass virus X]
MAIEAVFDQVTDPSLRSIIQEEAHKNIKILFKDTASVNPYATPQSSRKLLEKYAIPYNPYATKLHTHAVAKAFEVSLYETATHYLPVDERGAKLPVTFLFMKPAKLRFFKRRGDRDHFINAHIVPRDLARYPRSTVYATIPPIQTSHAFIGDTIHHFDRPFVEHIFRSSPALQTLIATMVLPPEAILRTRSLFPEAYDLHYCSDRFIYRPGALSGGEYEHTYESLDWLTVGHIHSGDLWITAERLESKAANHLFIFQRGKLTTPKYRTFDLPEPLVMLPKVFRPGKYNVQKPIPRAKANAWLMYVKSVGNVTIRDVWAKLRQTIANADLHNYEATELVHLTNYFMLVGRLESCNSFDQVLADSLLMSWFRPLVAKLTEFSHKVFGAHSFMQLCEAVSLKEVSLCFRVDETTYKAPKLPTEHFSELEELLSRGLAEEPTQTVKTESPTPSLYMHYDGDCEDIAGSGQDTNTPHSSQSEPHTATPATGECSHTHDQSQASTSGTKQERSLSEDADTLPWAPWAEHLKRLGFQGTERQLDADGELIHPIARVTKLPVYDMDDQLAQLLRRLNRAPTLYTPDTGRAQTYARDLIAGKTGARLRQESFEWKEALKKKTKESPKQVALSVIHGAGGSGKSRAIQEFMAENKDYPLTVVLPTNELRADWKRKLPAHEPDTFMTYETAMLTPRHHTMVLDDYTKLPNGYIEALIQNSPALGLLVLTGDPMQAEHHESSDGNEINGLTPASAIFSKYCRYYINATHRNPQRLANALGVYSEVHRDFKVSYSRHIRDGYHNLVPSQLKMRNYGSLGHKSSTYAGCQGITAGRVQIILDNDTSFCTRQVMYTALSRATTEIVLCNTMPNEKTFFDKIEATPYLKAILALHKELPVRTAEPEEEEPTEPPPPPTHLPVSNPVELTERLVEPLQEKHDREIYSPTTGHSNCVQTQDPYIQAFQHQQAKDETLFWATIDKRLRTSTLKDNWAEFKTKRPLGDVLWLAYRKAMGIPSDPLKFDPDLWWACADEVQKTYLSKSHQQLRNGMMRQSPDFGSNKMQIFLKSQWVKKADKIGKNEVKAGQTIAAFYQPTIMLFGTMARYMRRIRDTLQPKNILINCERSQEQIERWTKEHWDFKCRAYTNDFTAYDQSQDGAMLQFEVLKALHLGIPEEVVELYIQLKLDSKMFLGTLAIMRLTGEGPTFDANTECNIAYTHARFEIPDGCAQVYAGDDCAIDCEPTERQSFLPLVEKFTLQAKPQHFAQNIGSWPEFCGNLITPMGYLKDPIKLQACLALAARKPKNSPGSLADVADSYAIDLLPAYKLGDGVYEVFNEAQLHCHYQSIRTLITSAHTTRLSRLHALYHADSLF